MFPALGPEQKPAKVTRAAFELVWGPAGWEQHQTIEEAAAAELVEAVPEVEFEEDE